MTWMILGSDTEYTAGYAEARFARVVAGMTAQQAKRLLGEPLFESDSIRPFLETGPQGGAPRASERSPRFLWYSRSGSLHFAYAVRMLEISDGRVVRVYSSDYWD